MPHVHTVALCGTLNQIEFQLILSLPLYLSIYLNGWTVLVSLSNQVVQL